MFWSIDQMLELPFNRQAKCADPVCKINCNNIEFCQTMLSAHHVDEWIQWNGTTFANAACMALYGPDNYRSQFRQLYNEIVDIWKNKK